MTSVAQWQPARLPQAPTGAGADPAGRPSQFVSFAFYTLDPAWLRLSVATRDAGAHELASVIEQQRDKFQVHSYTTFGVRAETDFLLWRLSDDLDDFERMAAAMRRTEMGGYLQTPYSYLAMTGGEAPRPPARDTLAVGGGYLLVCPLARTGAWDALPEEERRDITRELLRLGHDAPRADGEMTYSVGLGAADGVLTFEADRPDVFAAWLEGLRRTRSGLYARHDTPVFIGARQDPATILAHIGGV